MLDYLQQRGDISMDIPLSIYIFKKINTASQIH